MLHIGMRRTTLNDDGNRLVREQQDVTMFVQRALIRSLLLNEPARDDWRLADLAELRGRLSEATVFHICVAGLNVELLSGHYVALINAVELHRTALVVQNRTSSVIGRSVDDLPTKANDLEEHLGDALAYRPRRHFCYELRVSKLELKAIAEIVGETPVDSGWQRVQQWLRNDKDLVKYAAIVHGLRQQMKNTG